VSEIQYQEHRRYDDLSFRLGVIALTLWLGVCTRIAESCRRAVSQSWIHSYAGRASRCSSGSCGRRVTHWRCLNDRYRLAESRRECLDSGAWPYCGEPFRSGLLDLPLTASILFCINNWTNTSRWSWKLRWHRWRYRRPYQSGTSRSSREWSTDNWRYRWQNLGSKTRLRHCRGFAKAPRHGDFRKCMHATDDIGHTIGDHYKTTKSYCGGHRIPVQIAWPRNDRHKWHQSTAWGRYTRLCWVLPFSWSLSLDDKLQH